MEALVALFDFSTWLLFYDTKILFSNEKARVACGEGTQSTTEVTYSFMPPICKEGG